MLIRGLVAVFTQQLADFFQTSRSIHLNSKVAEAFGAIKGQKTPITIDLQEGALVIKKA